MSKTHKDAPFTMSAEQSAKVILNKLEKSGIVYGNTGLFIVSIIIKILPYFLFKKVKL